MRKRSLLFAAVRKMMKQDEWQRKYDPDQMFDVVPYDYETQREYLKALRDEWQWSIDPGGHYSKYVNVNKYNNFEDYQYDINKQREKEEEW